MVSSIIGCDLTRHKNDKRHFLFCGRVSFSAHGSADSVDGARRTVVKGDFWERNNITGDLEGYIGILKQEVLLQNAAGLINP